MTKEVFKKNLKDNMENSRAEEGKRERGFHDMMKPGLVIRPTKARVGDLSWENSLVQKMNLELPKKQPGQLKEHFKLVG